MTKDTHDLIVKLGNDFGNPTSRNRLYEIIQEQLKLDRTSKNV